MIAATKVIVENADPEWVDALLTGVFAFVFFALGCLVLAIARMIWRDQS